MRKDPQGIRRRQRQNPRLKKTFRLGGMFRLNCIKVSSPGLPEIEPGIVAETQTVKLDPVGS
jgi:hypothetical protein